MSLSTFRCVWKIFKKFSDPIQTLLIDVILLFLLEFIKFCLILVLVFAVGYSIFYLWHTRTGNGEHIFEVRTLKSERLSDRLMENGSFSKYPYVVEVPSKQSAE